MSGATVAAVGRAADVYAFFDGGKGASLTFSFSARPVVEKNHAQSHGEKPGKVIGFHVIIGSGSKKFRCTYLADHFIRLRFGNSPTFDDFFRGIRLKIDQTTYHLNGRHLLHGTLDLKRRGRESFTVIQGRAALSLSASTVFSILSMASAE